MVSHTLPAGASVVAKGSFKAVPRPVPQLKDPRCPGHQQLDLVTSRGGYQGNGQATVVIHCPGRVDLEDAIQGPQHTCAQNILTFQCSTYIFTSPSQDPVLGVQGYAGSSVVQEGSFQAVSRAVSELKEPCRLARHANNWILLLAEAAIKGTVQQQS